MLRARRERIHNKTITLQHGCPDVRGRAGDTADRHKIVLYSGLVQRCVWTESANSNSIFTVNVRKLGALPENTR